MKNLTTTLKILSLSLLLSMTHYLSANETLIENYTAMAVANYHDTLQDAIDLDKAVNIFAKNPTNERLKSAKLAWKRARESYGESEIFRLSGGPIDAESGWVHKAYGALEPQLNAWPLDENMIDYTLDAEGKKTRGNIIDTLGVFNPGGEDAKAIDVSEITIESLTALNENGGDANVATGYHAIEFLLWGQDQDYSNFLKDSVTNGALRAGQRPLSDFTTAKYAKRRLAYLQTVSAKLVLDLSRVVSAWDVNVSSDCDVNPRGCYRGAINMQLVAKDAKKNISKNEMLKNILLGMGKYLKSEVANERIAVAVLTPSEEDEQSCFSDNTHRDIAVNYQGFKNLLTGRYKAIHGASFMDKLTQKTKDKITKLMASIEEKIESIDKIAKTKAHFDYQIQPNNPQAFVIKKLKNQMRKLGNMMTIVAKENGINLHSEK